MTLRKSTSYAVLAAALAVTGTSCKSTQGGSSGVKGFSYASTTTTVNNAVLITASSHTPSYGRYFETDMNNFYGVISNPIGNWQFHTSADREATKPSMQAAIINAASTVSDDGTLLLMFAAHGAQNGMLETDQAPGGYANFGYADVLAAIQQGRQGKPFKRLVLMISTCYSGSWLPTLTSSGGLIQQRLIITSVGPSIESNIGQATGSMLRAFQSYAQSPNLSMRQFLQTTQRSEPNLTYAAVPDAMLDEPFVNPATLPNPPATSTGDSTGASTDGTAATATDTPATVATVALAADAAAGASVTQGSQTTLFIYSKDAATKIEVQNPSDSKWYVANLPSQAAGGWATISGLSLDQSWGVPDTVAVRITTSSGAATGNVTVTH